MDEVDGIVWLAGSLFALLAAASPSAVAQPDWHGCYEPEPRPSCMSARTLF